MKTSREKTIDYILKMPINWRKRKGVPQWSATAMGEKCTLTMNDFPAEPLYTLRWKSFCVDIDNAPTEWKIPYDQDFISAIYRKDMDTIQSLISKGADINAMDKDGRTPLMHAVLAEDANPEIIKRLIKFGANPNVHDKQQKWTALHFAARDQKKDIVEVLVGKGASVDAVDVFGNTPLWRCVMNSSPNLEIVKVLLRNGADPRKKNDHGVSAYDTALNMGDNDLQQLFG